MFKIEDTFEITDRGGLTVIPGLAETQLSLVQLGSKLELVRPDGTRTSTVLGGIESLSPSVAGRPYPILLKGLSRVDVPVGTEVWLSA